jgi:hypothetical protein
MTENKKKNAVREISGSRWNAIISAVNGNIPKEKADLKNEAEEALYDSIKAEADALEKRGGVRPVFDMVEIESDDPVLDIYSSPAEKRK